MTPWMEWTEMNALSPFNSNISYVIDVIAAIDENYPYPVGKIAKKTVWRSERTPSDCFFGDFAHWVTTET